MDRAELNLTGLRSESAKVEKALGRIGDSLSGSSLIRQATLTAEAIKRLGAEGGVSAGLLKLTSTELDRAGQLAAEATTKLRLMGKEVPAQLQAVADSIKPLPQNLTLAAKAADVAESSFSRMFSAFTAANLVDRAVGAIGNLIRSAIDFGKEAITAAGKTADLADKLGLSTTAIQRMEAVARETGATVDDFASAAFKLGVRLSGGGNSVTDSVKDLGLSFQQLKALTPEQQFEKVVESLGKVDDATKRNALGVALFGKSFESIAAGVAGDYKKIADAAGVASEAQIRALDAAGDAWERFKTRAQRATQDVLGTLVITGAQIAKSDFLTNIDRILKLGGGGSTGFTGLAAVIAEANADAAKADRKKAGFIGPKLVEPIPPTFIEELKKVDAQVKALTASQRDQIKAALALGESHERIADKLGIGEDVLKRYVSIQKDATKATRDDSKAAREAEEAWKPYLDLLDRRGKLESELIHSVTSGDTRKLQALTMRAGLPGLPPSAAGDIQSQQNVLFQSLGIFARPGAATSGVRAPSGISFGQSLQGAFAGLPDVIIRAFEGGGNVTRSIGSLLGSSLLGEGTGINRAISGGLSKILGGGGLASKIGGFAGSILPGVGALIGPVISGITGLFKRGGVFGGGEGAKTNIARDQAVEAFTGISGDKFASQSKLREMAAAAGIASSELDRLFSTKRTSDFESAMASVTRRISEFTNDQEADTQRLNVAMEKYGLTIENLGQGEQQKRLNDQAKELIEDWRVLIGAGVEITDVNNAMSEEINKYLQTAVKLGTDVPNAFKPILQKMLEQGTLTDEAGNAITDLEKAGIHFSESMTEGFDKVVKKLDELIEKIGLASVQLGSMPVPSVPTGIIDPNSYSNSDLVPIPMASGGRGRVTQPTLFVAGEKGPEDVAFSGANRSFSGSPEVVAAIESLDSRIASLMRIMPIALRDAMLLAR